MTSPKSYIISFDSGIVGHFEPGTTLEAAQEQILQRCENLGMGGKLLDHSNYAVVGTVSLHGSEWSYAPAASVKAPRMKR